MKSDSKVDQKEKLVQNPKSISGTSHISVISPKQGAQKGSSAPQAINTQSSRISSQNSKFSNGAVKSSTTPATTKLPPSSASPPPIVTTSTGGGGGGLELKIKFTYKGRNSEEIDVEKGEIVKGIQKVQNDQWWLIENAKGSRGLIPANYVTPISSSSTIASSGSTTTIMKKISKRLSPERKKNATDLEKESVMSTSMKMDTAPIALDNSTPPPPPPKPSRKPSFLKSYDPSVGLSALAQQKNASLTKNVDDDDDVPLPPPPKSTKPRKKSRAMTILPESATPGESMRYTMFGHNVAYCSALIMAITGGLSFLWNPTFGGTGFFPSSFQVSFTQFDQTELVSVAQIAVVRVNLISSIYACAAALIIFCYEYYWGLIRNPGLTGFPFRGVIYILGSIPLFFSDPLCLGGVSLILAGLIHCVAAFNGESGDVRHIKGNYMFFGRKNKHHEDGSFEQKSCCSRFCGFERRGQSVFVIVYVIINIGLALEALYRWSLVLVVNCVGGPSTCPSIIAPGAKMFGQLLNFNSALILLPVTRSLLAKLNNTEITPKVSIATFIPLRKNVIFHKLIAATIVLATLGHVSIHYINFSIAPVPTLGAFGGSPWTSGIFVTIAMVIIYSGAQNRVKRAHYEIFFVSHHAFVVFFTFLLAHGPVFFIWAFIPITLYVLERVNQLRKGNKPFYLRKVRFIPPVMELEFCPKNKEDFTFKEGMYTYIASPYISSSEWHPFTISSCHYDLIRDDTISLHIRVQAPGSWTYRLNKYFSMMAKPKMVGKDGRFELLFSRYDKNGVIQKGKHLGPDGSPLIIVDGPHSAPAQHYSEYADTMIIGAGIGLTPVSSILKAVLRQKWKLGFQPHAVHFYWIVRQSEVDSFTWFVELLYELMSRLASDRVAGAISPDHHIDINIYVSGVPKKATAVTVYDDPVMKDTQQQMKTSGKAGGDPDLGPGYNVNIGFTQKDLHYGILNPTQKAKDQKTLQTRDNKPSNRFMDVWVWEGRPEWEDIFAQVKQNRAQGVGKIGVCFCGTPVIGKDLKRHCRDFSSTRDCTFSLHKENF